MSGQAGQILDRVIDVVREETEGLRGGAGDGRSFDIHASGLRKQRLLLDLHHMPVAHLPQERVRALREALEENATELSARLEAVRRVADIALTILRDDGADGTYATPRPSRAGRR